MDTGMTEDEQPYDGRWAYMSKKFRYSLVELIEWLLNPSNLKIKKINNDDLTCSEAKLYLEAYFSKLKSDSTPKAESIYETTVEKYMNGLIKKYVEAYLY